MFAALPQAERLSAEELLIVVQQCLECQRIRTEGVTVVDILIAVVMPDDKFRRSLAIARSPFDGTSGEYLSFTEKSIRGRTATPML